MSGTEIDPVICSFQLPNARLMNLADRESLSGSGEVRIDIGGGGGGGDEISYESKLTYLDFLQSLHGSCEERIDIGGGGGDEISYESMKLIEATLGLGGQAVGAVMAVAFASSTPSLPLYFVELSIILGLIFTYAAIALRPRKPPYSVVLAKTGSIATAMAIIVSVASRLPPLLAFAVAPFAVLIVSVAIVFS